MDAFDLDIVKRRLLRLEQKVEKLQEAVEALINKEIGIVEKMRDYLTEGVEDE